MRVETKRLALSTLLGVVVFLSKTLVPSPFDKMFIVVQALILTLGGLLLRRMGATYVAVVGGVLTAFWRAESAPFTFVFALLYGLFVDGFLFIFKVNPTNDGVKTNSLVVSITLSTALIGLLSNYAAVAFGLLPRNPMLEVGILIVGTLNGIAAGYLASIIWNRYLKNVRF